MFGEYANIQRLSLDGQPLRLLPVTWVLSIHTKALKHLAYTFRLRFNN